LDLFVDVGATGTVSFAASSEKNGGGDH
jgi:hypothetical protein